MSSLNYIPCGTLPRSVLVLRDALRLRALRLLDPATLRHPVTLCDSAPTPSLLAGFDQHAPAQAARIVCLARRYLFIAPRDSCSALKACSAWLRILRPSNSQPSLSRELRSSGPHARRAISALPPVANPLSHSPPPHAPQKLATSQTLNHQGLRLAFATT